MSEEDVGLPEETAGKLDQEPAVDIVTDGPWRKPVSGPRQIFQNIDSLFKHGEQLSLAGRKKTMVIVVDNVDNVLSVLYPNQPNYWMIERFPMDPVVFAANPDGGAYEFLIEPLYEAMLGWKEEGDPNYKRPAPRNSVQVSTYKGVPVYLPDPTLDYSRPGSTTGTTTGKNTGTTVKTTTTETAGTAGVVTTSEELPDTATPKQYKTVKTRGVDKDGFSYTEIKQVEVTPTTDTTEVGLDAFGGTGAVSNPDANDPRGSNQRKTPPASPVARGGRGNGAAEVAQRQAEATVAQTTAARVETGTTPCLPNTPSTTAGAAASGATPPASVPYDDAILRRARALSAAPASVAASDPLDAFGGTGGVVEDTLPTTSPTTVSQSSPTYTATANSPSSNSRPPSVYIYEALTPGFDRYDFNSGKKVYTPNSGVSRNAQSQTTVPDATPVVPSNVNETVIPVGTTTGGPSRLRQRQAALSGGAG